MKDIKIIPYTTDDNKGALELESVCPQGNEICLKYVRPYFHARSEVYDIYKILCAKKDEKLIAITAAASKQVTLHGKNIRALYGYDLRVHPEYRKHGTARTLSKKVMELLGNEAESHYTFVAAQNERALALARVGFGAKTIIPLTYFIFPVYKRRRVGEYETVSGIQQNQNYLKHKNDLEFIPEYQNEKMLGYVESINLNEKAGCSVWTNENLLAEQITRLPFKIQFLKVVGNVLKHMIPFPSIPSIGEILKSWFLYDLYAEDTKNFTLLLNNVNNIALEKGKIFIYILLQDSDPVIKKIKNSGIKHFTLPYYFLAAGKEYPEDKDKLYIDIRDL